jgi:hypothetical protein
MPKTSRRSGTGVDKPALAVVREAAQTYAAMEAGARPTRKNHYLHQAKLDLAKKILGVATETEAIDVALDLVIYGETLAQGTEAMTGETYHDVLGVGDEVPESGG